MDIGANLGYYSLLAAAQNKNIQIIAFEPLPDANAFLRKNIKLNGFTNVVVEPLALADKAGEVKFFFPVSADFPDQMFQLAGDGSLVNYDQAVRKEITVKTTRLDDYFQSTALSSLDLIKIDTETTEHVILENGRNTLARCRPVILCEVIKGYNEKRLEQLLKHEEYLFYKIMEDGLIAEATLTDTNHAKNDFLMVPGEKKELIEKFIK